MANRISLKISYHRSPFLSFSNQNVNASYNTVKNGITILPGQLIAALYFISIIAATVSSPAIIIPERPDQPLNMFLAHSNP